ncbi:MAG: bifunctional DNA primase/polymerase [Patescibacteria group bacterium]
MDNEKLNAALRYQAQGLSIIPANLYKKALVEWEVFQQKPPDQKQIIAWWKKWPDANPALITGAVSGMVVFDLDTKYGRTESEFQIPPTACSKTGRGGKHFFFKHPGMHVKTASGIFGEGADIRGDGGYALLPSSINSEGGEYEWLLSIEEGGLADMPSWLLEKTTAQQEKKWESGMNGVVEGTRNDTATSMAGKILQLSPQLWESIGWPTFVEWNKKNSPPLELKELKTVWASIKNLHLRKSTTNADWTAKEDKKLTPAISLGALIDTKFPDARFIVEQLIETGTINMLSAPPNKWKSWTALEIAIRVGSGTLLFGHFKTIQQPVMIVNEEDRARLLQDRLNMMLGGEQNLPIFFHIDKGIKFDTTSKITDQLIAEAKEKGIGLIIFDSLRSVHDFEENSSQEMQLLMDQFKKITHEGITVLFTHHNRKRMKGVGNREDWDDARGSTAINAAVHGHLACDEVDREDGTKALVIYQHKLKAAAKIPPFEVKVEISKDPSRIGFIYEGEYKAKEKVLSKVRTVIFNVFEESSFWLSINDVLLLKIAKETTVRAIIRAFVKEGLLQEKSLSEARALGLPIQSQDAQHNTKVYFHLEDCSNEESDLFDTTAEVAPLPSVSP